MSKNNKQSKINQEKKENREKSHAWISSRIVDCKRDIKQSLSS